VAHDATPPIEQAPALAIRPDATYLITGGLSGLGLLTAQWLVEKGARHLALVGRRPPSDDARAAMSALEDLGASVHVFAADVSREADVLRVLAALGRTAPPLSGVVHAAGVLDDGALVQQEWDRFERVIAPKVFGAWHLDRALDGTPLDFFVLYSSVASVLGSPGQSNHAAANAWLDAYAHQRRADGVPMVSINWGAWSEIGAAVERGVTGRAGDRGLGTIAPAEGLVALERMLGDATVQAAVMPMDWQKFLRDSDGNIPAFLSRLATAAPAAGGPQASPPAALGLRQLLEDTPESARVRVLHGHVRELAARVLGTSVDGVDVSRPLNEQGLDSLMAIELRNLLGGAVGSALSATLLFDYPTIDAVVAHLSTAMGLVAEAAPPVACAPDMLDNIADLSDQEVDRLFAERLAGR
jgi:NAD(P)-dependent dehydrogenase (short-subunit alcohol dehydrogenase family)/acyl carrier protein